MVPTSLALLSSVLRCGENPLIFEASGHQAKTHSPLLPTRPHRGSPALFLGETTKGSTLQSCSDKRRAGFTRGKALGGSGVSLGKGDSCPQTEEPWRTPAVRGPQAVGRRPWWSEVRTGGEGCGDDVPGLPPGSPGGIKEQMWGRSSSAGLIRPEQVCRLRTDGPRDSPGSTLTQ